jgi:hypothetical protein
VSTEKEVAIAQVDAALAAVDDLRGAAQTGDWSDLPSEGAAVQVQCIATVERLTKPGSSHRALIKRCEEDSAHWQHKDVIETAVGSLRALKREIEAGFLTTLTELIHGELFADFLEMATHLLDSGYKDAAVVVAGSTLEGHLRQLAEKTEIPSTNEDGQPLKADRLNADLAKVGAYGKTDQKSITAWLGLRNHAAHGDYKKYEAGQVGPMIAGIRDFIRRNPA